MKVVQINIFPNLSTGNIMMNIHKSIQNNGIESYVVWGRGRKAENQYEIFMNDKIGVYLHALYTRFTDKTGFASKRATKKLLKRFDEIKPDIVHLHNIHGYYINIELLFNYLKENKIKVIWTLHDCWAFTGHCAYFDMVNCDKWKTECKNCPQINTYPISYKDNSTWNYNKKKELFTGLDLTLVTPSKWLADLVKKSFLKDYEVKVINNGIDTEIFRTRESDFRKKYDLENKKIILGVASTWSERKGLKDFIELAKLIDDNTKIVLVGLNDKQLKELPENIIGIKRTNTAIELAEIYSTADIFFNPTHEDNYPTTNLEAVACETPVVTYNTGGSPESAINGYIIKDLNEFINIISQINKNEISKNTVNISINNMTEEYKKLYQRN